MCPNHILLTSCTSLLYHSYLVLACFSENTLRMKLPFLWGWKVEGIMAYSPGGSLKRSHTSRVLMNVLLMATACCCSRISGPRWTLPRPWSWGWPGRCSNISQSHISLYFIKWQQQHSWFWSRHFSHWWYRQTYLFWHLQTGNRQGFFVCLFF